MQHFRLIKTQEIVRTEDDIKNQFQSDLISSYKKILPIKL